MKRLFAMGVFAVAVSGAGAATEYPVVPLPGTPSIIEGALLSVQPAKVVFEEIYPGESASRAIVIRNMGPELADPTLTMEQSASHFLVEHHCPTYLNPGDECLIAVVYQPKDPGEHEATIRFQYDGTAPYVIRLKARALEYGE